MSGLKKMYIGGRLVDGAGRIKVINPANDICVATVAAAGCDDVKQALKAADTAFDSWSQTSIAERQQWMMKVRDGVIAHEDHLRKCIHQEMGKDWHGTQEDFSSLKNSLEFYAQEITRVYDQSLPDRAGTHSHRLVHEPLGVVVAFIAWNFPLLNLAFKIGPALAAGCPIIIRPSSSTPLSAYAFGEICAKIGLPAGVVQILATANYQAADMLSSSPIPALLTLIGSIKTGRHIMKTGATTIKRYSMELGGNAPVLVFKDADLDAAADIICAVKFSNAGQICVTPNRVFVETDVIEVFIEKLIARAKAVNIGWDRHKDIGMGPLINRQSWVRVKSLVNAAINDGAKLLYGGKRPQHLLHGHFFEPTILNDVTENMQIYQQEIFAPIISLIGFNNHNTVLKQANDGDAGGLTAYIFTRDWAKAERFSTALRYGEIQINGVKYDIDLPHGGIGQSGMGHDCSYLALQDYLVIKRITRTL